jgi:hypothetical protein
VRAAEQDEEQLARYATDLADGVEAALAPWVERVVSDRCRAAGIEPDDDLRAQAASAGRRCRDEVAPKVRVLLSTDIDEQSTTPLTLLREAVRHPTAVLAVAGVPASHRDEFAERAFPEDRYGLAPATFGDLDEGLVDAGLVWGAAKAHVHLARRRAEGRR